MAKQNGINKTNIFESLNTAVTRITEAKKHYAEALNQKYGSEIPDLTVLLDSRYRKNYVNINSSLSKRATMDKLYTEYQKLIPDAPYSKGPCE